MKNRQSNKRNYWILIWLSLVLSACHSNTYQGITIATAANVQYAMQELTRAFNQKEGIPCQTVISSSGKLTAQIKEGAPYELLVSANMKYPQNLYQQGLTVEKPKVYALGKLVLWTQHQDLTPSTQALTQPKVQHVALANPKTAPYGEAALQVLQKAGLAAQLKEKLVFGESISQTNQFILSQSAEIGFTAKSVVVSPRLKGKGKWVEIDETFYQPIKQGVVLIKQADTKKMAQARKFYEFLFSTAAQKILQKYGYTTTPISQ
ncbi:molybdate ABC transporter substrate-binding protein [marine bacterium AO1-C]|nr:molybdate ABC transporter substrate-binding protein [marine bacterium AO1-C]